MEVVARRAAAAAVGLFAGLGRRGRVSALAPARTYASETEAAAAEHDAELDAFREQVRVFAQKEIAPLAHDIDASNAFPSFPAGEPDLWQRMGSYGLHGLTVPESKGGLGLGYQYHCVAMEEVSRASGAVGLSYGAHSNLCINQINRN